MCQLCFQFSNHLQPDRGETLLFKVSLTLNNGFEHNGTLIVLSLGLNLTLSNDLCIFLPRHSSSLLLLSVGSWDVCALSGLVCVLTAGSSSAKSWMLGRWIAKKKRVPVPVDHLTEMEGVIEPLTDTSFPRSTCFQCRTGMFSKILFKKWGVKTISQSRSFPFENLPPAPSKMASNKNG